MTSLEAEYVKSSGDEVNREALYDRKQGVGESVDDIWKDLQTLAWKCSLKARATAEENLEDHIRVAFLLALRSQETHFQITQRDPELDGKQALELARSLERSRMESEKKGMAVFLSLIHI